MTETDALALAPQAALTRPDAALALGGGETAARCGLWWREPVLDPSAETASGAATGRIGHVRWATAEAGAALLAGALDRLRAEGARRVVGPLDGSTWFGYRVVTDRAPGGAEEPTFAMEPDPPPVVAQAFEAAGFEPVAHYLSSRVDALPDESEAGAEDAERLSALGVAVRPLGGDADLAALHPLLLAAFAGNPFYAPLDLGRFLALYRPLLSALDPDLVLVAEAGRQPVGVVLALPDLAQRRRGEPVDTVVVKTLAVAPEWRRHGIGGALVRAAQEAARARGLTRAVHALMHVGNASVQISSRLGRPIRRYALLGRAL